MKARGCGRLAGAVVVATLVVVTAAFPAHADYAGDAATAVRSDLVFVHPEVDQRPTRSDVDQLVSRIRKGGRPIFIAVVPEAALAEAGGSPGALAARISERLGAPGTVGVIAAGPALLGAASRDDVDPETLVELVSQSIPAATRDLPAGRVSIGALADDFIRRVQAAPGSAIGALPPADDKAVGPVLVQGALALGAAVVGVLVVLFAIGRLRRRRERRRVPDGSWLLEDGPAAVGVAAVGEPDWPTATPPLAELAHPDDPHPVWLDTLGPPPAVEAGAVALGASEPPAEDECDTRQFSRQDESAAVAATPEPDAPTEAMAIAWEEEPPAVEPPPWAAETAGSFDG